MHACFTPLISSPDPSPVDVKYEGHGNQQAREACEDARTRPYSDVVVHGRHDQRERGSEAAPQEGVRRHGARGVYLEGVDEVVQRGLEDGIEAAPGEVEADDGHDPGDARVRGPARDELAAGEQDRPQHHGREALLGHGVVPRRVVRLVVVELVRDVDACTRDGAQAEGQEGQLARHERPPPHLVEDDRDRPELHVQYAVAERGVQRHQEADGRAQQLHGPDQELARQLFDADVPLLELGVQRPVARLVPQPGRLPHQQPRRVRFVDEDNSHEQHGGLQHAGDVLGPAPAVARLHGDGGRDDGPHGRPAHDGHRVPGHGDAAVRGREEVAEDAARVGDGGRGEEGAEEPREHHRLQVLGGGRREREADADEHGGQHGGAAAEDLGQRGPQQGADAEAEQEQGGAQRGDLAVDAELGGHLRGAGRVRRRRPRRRHGDEAVEQRRADLLVRRPVDRPVRVVGAVEVY